MCVSEFAGSKWSISYCSVYMRAEIAFRARNGHALVKWQQLQYVLCSNDKKAIGDETAACVLTGPIMCLQLQQSCTTSW